MKLNQKEFYERLSNEHKIDMNDIANRYFFSYIATVNGYDYDEVERILSSEEELTSYLTEFNKMCKENNEGIENIIVNLDRLYKKEKER